MQPRTVAAIFERNNLPPPSSLSTLISTSKTRNTTKRLFFISACSKPRNSAGHSPPARTNQYAPYGVNPPPPREGIHLPPLISTTRHVRV